MNDGVKSEGDWNIPGYLDITDSGKKKEVKAFTFHRIESEDVCERYIPSCFVEGLDAYDGVTDLEYEKSLISNEFVVKLGLQYEVKKNGEKVVNRKLLVALKGELYFVKFVINLEEDDMEPCVIFGRLFLKLAKAVVDFRSGILTIWLDLITFNFDSNDDLNALLASIDVDDLPPIDISDFPTFVCNLGKNLRIKKKPFKTYKMSYDVEGPSLTINRPRTQEELTKEEMKEDLYERIMLLNERRLITKTLKYSDEHKKLLDGVLFDKLKLDAEFELE
ncbi:hypothetical protein Tco_0887921 [Tanacetum coccineum]